MKYKAVIEFFKDKNHIRNIIYSVVIFIFVIYALFSSYGIVTTVTLQNKQKNLQKQINNYKIIADSLQEHIRLLKTDTLYIERVAREKYGLVKPNEKVFIIPQEKNLYD